MEYQETVYDALEYRASYLQGIEQLIEYKKKLNSENRNTEYVMAHPEESRKKLCEILGWPLAEERSQEHLFFRETLLSQEGECDVYRIELEVLRGLVLSGILLRHHGEQALPLILCQHGGLGTAERVTGIYGDTSNYNDMAERFYKQGANVFAPQLAIWPSDVAGPSYDRIELDSKLQMIGSSITAVELYGLMRAIDYFAEQKWVDNIGMAGLSYGGFYTLYLTALDERIKVAMTCAHFSDYWHWIKPDWAWRDMDCYFGEAELACLIYPRKLYIQMGDKDELFDYRKTEREYDRLMNAMSGKDGDWAELIVFDGNHEFIKENKSVVDMVSYLMELQKVEGE